MTNGEKFKTAKERAEAFDDFCKGDCANCNLRRQHVEAKTGSVCNFLWLDLEAPAEEPLPCPFCGRIPDFVTPYSGGNRRYACITCMCGYHSAVSGVENVISAHNRVARAAAKGKEANDGNAQI